MRILDLYCGVGLVAEGLQRAGWEVWGMDLVAQPRYPGPFIQADALQLDPRFVAFFDAIWASPPCLRDTVMRNAPGAKGQSHPELIAPTRRMLHRLGKPFIIENVMGAALVDPVVLCGSMFDLGVTVEGQRFHLERHRKFETNWPLQAPEHPHHEKPCVGIYGGHARIRSASAGGRGSKEPWPWDVRQVDLMAHAMGCRPGLTGSEISQGIPPAYACYVGTHLAAYIQGAR